MTPYAQRPAVPVRVGSLFSGIGGLDLGIEAALTDAGLSVRVAWQVEIEDYPRQVLARHWPDADRTVTDVRCAHTTYALPSGAAVTAGALERVDVLVGGFPCQDLSLAGRGAGLDGARSGLWWEFWRLIRALRPRVVVLENVAALAVRGLDAVLGALAALGYAAEWQVLSAEAVGAPHRRERMWVVAWDAADADGLDVREQPDGQPGRGRSALAVHDGRAGPLAHPDREGQPQPRGCFTDERGRPGDGGCEGSGAGVADADGSRLALGAGLGGHAAPQRPTAVGGCCPGRDHRRPEPHLRRVADGPASGLDLSPWADGEWDGVPRVAVGVPHRVPRLKALGNGVVPQQAYAWAGRRAAALLGAA